MFYNPRLFFTAVLAVYTLPAAAQDAPPDGPVTVGPPSVVSTVDEGIACKVNSVGSMVALDKSVMTLIYDDLSATIGPGIPTKNRRGYCQVDIDVGIPPGYTFAVQASDYRGFGKLDKGVSGTVNATYGYPPKTETSTVTQLVTGPVNDDFHVHQDASNTKIIYSGCQRTTKLRVFLAVQLTSTNSTGEGFIKADSTDFKAVSFNQTMSLFYRRCKK